jgi:hypothetical protein
MSNTSIRCKVLRASSDASPLGNMSVRVHEHALGRAPARQKSLEDPTDSSSQRRLIRVPTPRRCQRAAFDDDRLDGEDKSNPFHSAIATPRTARIPSHMTGFHSCLFMRNTEVGAHELARRAATRVQSRTSCNHACAPLTPQPLRGVRTQSSLRLRSVSAPCPRRERDCEDTYTPTDRILCQPTARERLACSPPESIVASF